MNRFQLGQNILFDVPHRSGANRVLENVIGFSDLVQFHGERGRAVPVARTAPGYVWEETLKQQA